MLYLIQDISKISSKTIDYSNKSIIFQLNTKNAIKNLSIRSKDSKIKRLKFISLLDKDIFSELPFFYKKCLFSFFNNLDRELEGKNQTETEIKNAIFKVIMTISPEVNLDQSYENIESKNITFINKRY